MVVDTDDLEPRASRAVAADLEKMSLEELKDYVDGLEREIDRVRTMIAAKEDHRASADQLFSR